MPKSTPRSSGAETWDIPCAMPHCKGIVKSPFNPAEWSMRPSRCSYCVKKMRTHVLAALCVHAEQIAQPWEVCLRGTGRLPIDYVAPCGCTVADFDWATTVWDWVLPKSSNH